MLGNSARAMPLCPLAQATFPRWLWFCWVSHQESLCCSLLRAPKHISCLDGIQFRLEHKQAFMRSCAFPLVPETPFTASKDGLGPQPSRCMCRCRSPVPHNLPRRRDGGRRKATMDLLLLESLSILHPNSPFCLPLPHRLRAPFIVVPVVFIAVPGTLHAEGMVGTQLTY